jgi:hypothetical protein
MSKKQMMLISNPLEKLQRFLTQNCRDCVILHLSVFCAKVLDPLTFFWKLFATSKLASNTVFLDTHTEIKKLCWDHISTFDKLWSQCTQNAQKKISENIFIKYVLEFMFASIFGSWFLIFWKSLKSFWPAPLCTCGRKNTDPCACTVGCSSQRERIDLLEYQAFLAWRNSWRMVVYIYYMYNSSWKFHQIAVGQLLPGQPVRYGKGRR